MASVRAGAKLSFSILWGHMLIKQPADNSNYLSVASAPHRGHTVRERSASSQACTSKRLILFLIRAHPEWYTKCSLPAILVALSSSASLPLCHRCISISNYRFLFACMVSQFKLNVLISFDSSVVWGCLSCTIKITCREGGWWWGVGSLQPCS